MKIGIANAVEVDAVWPQISARVERACKRNGGEINSGELWQMCRSGQAFLVLVLNGEIINGALIMQFQKWSGKSVMRCLGIVGVDMKSWLPAAREYIEKMARDGGATSFVAGGRVGWERVFPEAKKLRVIYEVDI